MRLNLANIGKNWKNKSGVYCLTVNNKNYIGSAECLNTRLKEHDLDLRNRDHGNKHLLRAYNKYKVCNFRVIEECNIDILIEKETYWYEILGDYNILHPKKRTGNSQSKKVYQYDLQGNLLNVFCSTGQAAKETSCHQTAISLCCKRKEKQKYHNGFLWSYKLEKNLKRKTDTAKEIHFYNLEGQYLRSFYCSEDAAKTIAKEENLSTHLTISSYIRKCASKQKGSVLRKYQIRFFKKEKIPEFLPFHKNSYKSN